MTDNLLKTALREAAFLEFSAIPQSDSDIAYTFSPRFTHRMNQLAKDEKNRLWRMTSTAPKMQPSVGGSRYCHDIDCPDCLWYSGGPGTCEGLL